MRFFNPVSIAFLLSTFLLSFLPNGSEAQMLKGVVRYVYDGDTVMLATRNSRKLKVRLYGIDAPETKKPGQPGQPYSEISKRTLMYKIMGRTVEAEIMDKDQYERVVAVLHYKGRDINREMVAEGVAWGYKNYLKSAYTSEYIGAEKRARSRRLGLWRDRNPLPPWEYRHALKKGKGNKHSWW